MTPSAALERLIQPPENLAYIQVVAKAFLPIAERISSLIEREQNQPLADLHETLPGVLDFCRGIVDDEAWRPASKEHRPKLTPHPVYGALLKIGEQNSLSREQVSILAHVFIAIWVGVSEAPDGKVPMSNLRHVFLEFRRPHLWVEGLESVDTSEADTTYTTLDELEQELKSQADQRVRHISPIRRLLGLSLQKESLIERDKESENEDAKDGDESETPTGDDSETKRILIDSEEAGSSTMMEVLVSPVRTTGDREKLFTTAERNALPAEDLVQRPVFATSPGPSKHRKQWTGANGVGREHAKSDQLRRSNQTLPNRWERPTEYELYVYWNSVTEPVDADLSAAVALLLVLLTGRKLELVLETQLTRISHEKAA